MKLIACFMVLLVCSLGEASSKLLSYYAWKTTKIHSAKETILNLKKEVKKAPEEELLELSKELRQAELNLSIAKELSANDYFVLYVLPLAQDDPRAIMRAAKSLNSKDVSDILEAYKKKLQNREEVIATTILN